MMTTDEMRWSEEQREAHLERTNANAANYIQQLQARESQEFQNQARERQDAMAAAHFSNMTTLRHSNGVGLTRDAVQDNPGYTDYTVTSTAGIGQNNAWYQYSTEEGVSPLQGATLAGMYVDEAERQTIEIDSERIEELYIDGVKMILPEKNLDDFGKWLERKYNES